MFGEKKCFTSANDNDYYCHAFRGWPHTKVKRVPMNARHCSHCFQYYLASLKRWLFFLHILSCGCVGCARSPRSHTCVCSRGFACWPPAHNSNYFEKISFHILSRGFVGCARSPRSHTCVCSRGFACWPPAHNSNYFEKCPFIF